MPLVRFEVRNEYGLGQPELYRGANREDPKAVLDGVAVAGLVGILRQLGDLAEFAAEVFHGLQEQLMTTASRSHNLKRRVQNIEAALPPLEKVVLAQSSHIHFAYTAGSEWHPRIQNEQNHFINNDLPRFVMDLYEECRDPPRLHVLDKFDVGGPGSCLRRYSDPTFFRRVAGNYKEQETEKVQKDKKRHKRRKKRSSQRHGDLLRSGSMSNYSGRMQFTQSVVDGRTSSHTASTFDMTLKSDLGDYSNSFDSRTGSSYIEGVFHVSSSVQHEEQESKEFDSKFLQHDDIPVSVSPDAQPAIAEHNYPCCSSPEQVAHNLSSVAWDEKGEVMEPKCQHYDADDAQDILTTDSDLDTRGRSTGDLRNPGQMDIMFDDEKTPKSNPSRDLLDEVESEPDDYMDALNTIESESENDHDCQIKHEVEQFTYNVDNGGTDEGICNGTAHISNDHSSKYESHTSSCDIASNMGISCDLQNTVSLTSVAHDQTYYFSGNSLNSEHVQHYEGYACADALDSSKVESVISDLPSSSSSDSLMHEPMPNTSGKSSNSNLSHTVEVSAIVDAIDCSKVESVVHELCNPPLNSSVHEQIRDMSAESSNSDHSPRVEDPRGADALDGTEVESVVHELCNPPSNSSVHEQIRDMSGESSNSEHSPGAAGSLSADVLYGPRSADALDGLKVESVGGDLCDLVSSVSFIHGKTSYLPKVEGPRCADALDGSKVESVGGDLCNLVSSDSFMHGKTSYLSGKSSNPDHSPAAAGSLSADVLYGPKLGVVSDPLSSGPGVPNLEEPLSNRSFSCSSTRSVTFWTNGGLLGLEPSKPPDFAMGRAANQDSGARSKDEASAPPNHTSCGEREKPDKLVKDSGNTERVLSSKIVTLLNGEQGAKVEKSGDSHHNSGSTHAFGGRLNISNAVTPGNGLPHDTNVKATSVGTDQENEDYSSKAFGHGPRLLVNGFHRQTSVVHDGNPDFPSSLRTGTSEQKSEHQNVTYDSTSERSFNGQFRCKSAIDSLTSSPPLEHMKMSFHPINGFEASKLKLKFPDGGHFNESTRDLFPSFQLVPEPGVPQRDVGSDSDDDTFCRSSPYMSDDYLSHHSESDSEQWECSESPELKDPELYDVLARVSAVESVSDSLQSGETGNKGEFTENNSDSLDLPCFDSVNTVLQGEHKDSLHPQDIIHSQYPTGSSPLPPPLPPVQWRVSKPQLGAVEEKHHAISEAHRSAFDLTILKSSLSQLKPAPANEEQTNEDATALKPKSKPQDWQKQNWQKEVNQSANGKGMDEKEDFLQQIRTKSYALRHTAASKSTFASGGTANDKVSAILEKANAIRQAVGSDDEEDNDPWSDS